ncbi:MAG TPA: SDR family oxidoreductase, partial [Trebonia sp.]|nr:SDR family oxidoreductase [Trebonia sp.]
TGASGGIGSAVVSDLIAAGHEVVGLARSDASARAVEDAGAIALRGDLTDPGSLRAGAAAADGVIHLAFDSSDFGQAVAKETLAVKTFGAALEETGKALVIASGTPAAAGRAATEEDPANTDGPLGAGPLGGRAANAQTVLGLAARGVRSAVVRLPRCVHAQGQRYGLASGLIAAARRTGVSGYVGDGSQRWPAVHRLDAARLFRLTLEQAEPGTVAHAVADEGVSLRAIAEVIGRGLGLPARPVPADTFGLMGALVGVDQPASSTLTRERFGWRPTGPGLLDDLEAGNYPA